MESNVNFFLKYWYSTKKVIGNYWKIVGEVLEMYLESAGKVPGKYKEVMVEELWKY